MSLITLGKRVGLVVAAFLITASTNMALFTAPASAQAATYQWVNRGVIKSADDYFVDPNPYDSAHIYTALKRSVGGECEPKQLIGPAADESYYNNTLSGGLIEVDWEKLGGSGPNAGTCSRKPGVNVVHPDKKEFRRINFIRSNDGQTITHIQTNAVFTLDPSLGGGIKKPVFINKTDAEQCKDVIVDFTADPQNDDWFGGGFTQASAQLYATKDNSASLERVSESLPYILGGVRNGTICKAENEAIVSSSGRYPLMDSGADGNDLAAAGWREGTDIVETSGERGDDSYIIFIGNVADNTIPPNVPNVPPPVTGPTTSPIEVCEDEEGMLAHILCGAVNIIDGIINSFYENLIIPFLTVPALTTIPGLQAAWGNIRDVANILFIIVFFIIVFSQATSIGISNYGIKSLLPKLIAMAVLANVSFFVCMFAVDAFNIFGLGISSLIMIPLQNLPPQPDVNFGTGPVGLLQSIAGISLMSGVLAAQGGILGAVIALGIPILLGMVVTVLVLVLRMVLIVGFVVFSPIIFIGFILPGTARMASRMLNGFIGLLALGPIFLAIIALSGFAIYIINLVLA